MQSSPDNRRSGGRRATNARMILAARARHERQSPGAGRARHRQKGHRPSREQPRRSVEIETCAMDDDRAHANRSGETIVTTRDSGAGRGTVGLLGESTCGLAVPFRSRAGTGVGLLRSSRACRRTLPSGAEASNVSNQRIGYVLPGIVTPISRASGACTIAGYGCGASIKCWWDNERKATAMATATRATGKSGPAAGRRRTAATARKPKPGVEVPHLSVAERVARGKGGAG